MIGTCLAEALVQSVALSHLIKGHRRTSLLMLAAPESGKTTIASASDCKHVARIAVISGRSVLRELRDNPKTEFLLFNDMSAIRAMSAPAVSLLIVILNQLTQDERGKVAFAGQSVEEIDRPVGIIGCIPFQTFADHRARWRELGFISRMIPFAYQYGDELVAEIKDAIDAGAHANRVKAGRRMPKNATRQVGITMNESLTKELRRIADAKSAHLGQLGIRLLQNYHSLIRAHALLSGRRACTREDIAFIRGVNEFVSVTDCKPL